MDPFTAFVALGVLPALIDEFMGSDPTAHRPPPTASSFGFDPTKALASVSPSFLRSRPASSRSVAIAPGTGRSSPADRLSALARPFSLHRPQILADGSVHAVVEGPFWAALAVEASKVARDAGMGLRVEVGLGVEVSVAEGSVTPTIYRFVLPTR